jgi:carbon monoxide dehydrogenase subunit G
MHREDELPATNTVLRETGSVTDRDCCRHRDEWRNMVTLLETIEVDRPLNEAFAFVSDFANAEDWDPGVVESRREDDGPVGIGATYRLVVRFRGTSLPMTYRIVEFHPPRRVVLRGEGSTVRAVDEISLEPVGNRTRLTYRADLRMRGLLAVTEPFLRRAFDRMGKRAVEGLRQALDHPSSAASLP